MIQKLLPMLATVLASAVAVLATPAGSAPLYVATPLGTLGGLYSRGNAINASGQVTGYSWAADNHVRAFLHTAGTMTDLGPPGGDSNGTGVNASGQVTGSMTATDGNVHAFFYSNGVLTTLGTPGVTSTATGINDRGQVVGTYAAGSGAFIYADGVFADLGIVANGSGIQPSGINAIGEVAGTAYSSGSAKADAYLYSTTQSTNLGAIGGSWTVTAGLNDSGQVTGMGVTASPTTHAFLYSGSMRDLGTIGAYPELLYSAGKGVNNAGQVVGYSELLQYSGTVAFLYTDGVMYDLNALVHSGLGAATLTEAVAINDHRQIVANYCFLVQGLYPECNAFRLDPISPPTAVAVEYYYEAWNYYFQTSLPDEIAALDGGAFGGAWKRTGQTFNVWPQANPNSSPTCRFFSTTFAPKSTHVYTPFAAECASLKGSPDWQYEGIAFHIQLASADGLCTDGTIPLYRLYNNGMGGAPNHRYTTSQKILDQMIAAGWVFEGNGNTKVFACVPQ
jgi:probable HAF family extracellular repeat protein